MEEKKAHEILKAISQDEQLYGEEVSKAAKVGAEALYHCIKEVNREDLWVAYNYVRALDERFDEAFPENKLLKDSAKVLLHYFEKTAITPSKIHEYFTRKKPKFEVGQIVYDCDTHDEKEIICVFSQLDEDGFPLYFFYAFYGHDDDYFLSEEDLMSKEEYEEQYGEN